MLEIKVMYSTKPKCFETLLKMFFKFRGLLVSRKQILYFISVSNNLRQRYPLPLFGFGSIYVYCRLSTLTTGMHIYYAIPPVSPSRW